MTMDEILKKYPGLRGELESLPFEHRVSLAHLMALRVACCIGCGCYLNSPDCNHDEDMAETLIDASQEGYAGGCGGCDSGDRTCELCGEELSDGEDDLCLQCEDDEAKEAS